MEKECWQAGGGWEMTNDGCGREIPVWREERREMPG